MSRTESNNESNHKSNRVDRVEQGRIKSRTGSNHESNRVEHNHESSTSARVEFSQNKLFKALNSSKLDNEKNQ